MFRIYRSRSEITVRVQLPFKLGWKTICFHPDSSGGSYYLTGNGHEQLALRQHPRYGSLFTESQIEPPE